MATKMRSSPPPDLRGGDGEPANDLDGAPPLPPLTPQQEALVQLALPCVERCAREVARCYRRRFTPEDLLGAGTIGLIGAARDYDEERHPSFLHYAWHYVRGAMLNVVRTELFSSRARVEHAMERAFTGFEIHHVADVDLFAGTEEQLLEGGRQGSADALAAAFTAAVTAAREHPSDTEMALLLRIDLRRALLTLHRHELQMIKLVHEDGKSVAEASRELLVHTNTGQNRYQSALRKLRAYFTDTDVPRRR
jgi:RNA polymerase sigma factor (sigma-70 family)